MTAITISIECVGAFGFIADDFVVAGKLRRKVRVLCSVMTQKSNHQSKAEHVKSICGPFY